MAPHLEKLQAILRGWFLRRSRLPHGAPLRLRSGHLLSRAPRRRYSFRSWQYRGALLSVALVWVGQWLCTLLLIVSLLGGITLYVDSVLSAEVELPAEPAPVESLPALLMEGPDIL